MKTSIAHLPQQKQDLINHIIKIIVEKIQPEKIILYGSYATGKWVEDEYEEDGRWYDYISDYDFLVITKSGEKKSDYEVQEIVEHRMGLNVQVSAITHDIDYINGKLSEGQYFFSDIQKEGILLYDSGNVPLAKRRELSINEKQSMMQNDFNNWYTTAKSFLKGVYFYLKEGDLKIATFMLHQSAERTYNTVILVFRGYKPKTHNLEKLHRYAKHFSVELAQVFPQNSEIEKHLFNLLKKGYVEARYDKNFTISREEVQSLIEKVSKLQLITETICNRKINSLE
ncbi:MAG: HEPN domain-containing protein [Chitinophagaceae bacterium]|nr:MAG: HEPN domain-containing protein [Chitinophagaceae bacterium]